MSVPLNARDCVLRISGEPPAPTLLVVEGLRLTSWKIQQEVVDVTTGSDGSWTHLLSGAGVKSLSVQLAGLFLGSPGERRLREAALSGTAFVAEITLGPGELVQGSFVASELSFESTISEEATYTALLRSAGPIAIG